MKYDYLIVGAGLFGATFAYFANKAGKTCLVIEQRKNVGGNIYCQEKENIVVHKYGPHIFHTSNKSVYNFVTSLVEVYPYFHQPMACYRGELYNLPFNMNTFRQMWNVKTAQEARMYIEKQKRFAGVPANLEEQAISMVGEDIYKKLIQGYTEKQWGIECKRLPASIIQRIPLRFTYDNSYFNDRYQFIPVGGYNTLIKKLLRGAKVIVNFPFAKIKDEWREKAEKLVFTGRIDSLFEYKYGELPYRSVRFSHEVKDTNNFQGCAVMNYTSINVAPTRSIEHRFFERSQRDLPADKTIVTWEFPNGLSKGDDDAYYPINLPCNEEILKEYKSELKKHKDILVGGRLGDYRYYDMDDTIKAAMQLAKVELLK